MYRFGPRLGGETYGGSPLSRAVPRVAPARFHVYSQRFVKK